MPLAALVSLLLSDPSVIPTDVALSLSGIITPLRKTDQGLLVNSTAYVWDAIALKLQGDWSLAYQIPPASWEEIIAGAFDRAGYEVILTPRSGDHGRDVIATRAGVGS